MSALQNHERIGSCHLIFDEFVTAALKIYTDVDIQVKSGAQIPDVYIRIQTL